MTTRPPALAYVLGFAGLVPFVATSLGTMAAGNAIEANRYLAALVGYGAVILAFLGGVQWGFVLSPLPGDTEAAAGRSRGRLVLAVAPSLVGWAALLVLLVGLADLSIAILLAGLIAFTAAEIQLNRRGLMPPGYMLLRWILSIVVALLLATTLVVRLIGGRVVF